jgi:hypothetical protein
MIPSMSAFRERVEVETEAAPRPADAATTRAY